MSRSIDRLITRKTTSIWNIFESKSQRWSWRNHSTILKNEKMTIWRGMQGLDRTPHIWSIIHWPRLIVRTTCIRRRRRPALTSPAGKPTTLPRPPRQTCQRIGTSIRICKRIRIWGIFIILRISISSEIQSCPTTSTTPSRYQNFPDSL